MSRNNLFQQINELFNEKSQINTTPTQATVGGVPVTMTPLTTNDNAGVIDSLRKIQMSISAIEDKITNMPNMIVTGMDVYAAGEGFVAVTAGKVITKEGVGVFDVTPDIDIEQAEDVCTLIPIDRAKIGVKYIIAIGGKNQELRTQETISDEDLIIAKIVINIIDGTIYDDSTGINNYIVSGKDLTLGTDFKIDDDTKLAISSILDELLAENLTGTLTLSEGLSITNLDDSVKLGANGIDIYNSDTRYAQFNKDGVYFFQTDGQLLSHYSSSGATIGNMRITPTTIQSTNFNSGNKGYIIKSDGDVEFNNAKFRGTIVARDGTIGKWTIGRDRLTNVSDTTGLAPQDYPFYAGESFANRASAPFRVTASGALYATNATISGNITANKIEATSGHIGGWTVNTTSLSGGNTIIGSSGYLTLGTGNNIVQLDSRNVNRIWIGNQVSGSANFRVTQSGVLYATGAFISGNITANHINATSGLIGGWTIQDGLLSGGVMKLYASGVISTTYFNVSASGLLTTSNATISGNITADTLTANTAGNIAGWTITEGKLTNGLVGLEPANYPFYAGNATASSAPFRVTASGALYAINATISGNITANKINAVSGNIGGWTIQDGLLSGGNMQLYSSGVIHTTNFNVSNTGVLSATAAIINGNITATTLTTQSGTIGGWTIGATSISGGGTVLYNTGVISATNAIIQGSIDTGNLTASGGTIGGWTIADNTITGGSTVLNSNGNIHTANFDVSTSGIVSATGAIINGNITATTLTTDSGTIGGWTIGNTSLSGGQTVLSSSGRITVGSGQNIAQMDATNANYRLWIGDTDPTLAEFSVTKEGLLYATNATISGNITANHINANSGLIGGWTIQDGLLSGGVMKLYSSGVIHSTNFNVNNIGVISATSATLKSATVSGTITTDNITARGGTIGGWTIQDSVLSGGVMQLYASGVIHSTNFNVSNIGVVSATSAVLKSATVSGNITCNTLTANTSGTIGGFTIAATQLSAGGTLVLDSSGDGEIKVGDPSSTHIRLMGGATSYIQSSNFDNSVVNPKGFRFGSDGVIEAVDGVFRGKLESNVFVKNEVNVAGGTIVLAVSTRCESSAGALDTTLTLQSGVFINNDIIKVGNSDELIRVISGGTTTSLVVDRGYNSTTEEAINSKSVIFKIGEYSTLNKGYIELLGESNIIKIHDVDDSGGTLTDTVTVELGLLTQGTKSGQYGLYAQTAEISGNITATTLTTKSGTIGGWTIADTSITGGSTILNSNGNIHTNNFNVSTSGIISAASAYLREAVISGTITASAGEIGGWTLGNSTITGGSTILNSNGVIHTPNFNVSSTGIISATSAILKSATVSGAITCSTLTANTAGTIAGWTITDGKLANSNVGMQPATYPFYAGHATPSSAPFRVDTSGNLIATNATISGNITATTIHASSGTIGGWTIGANSISGGGTVLYDSGVISATNANIQGTIDTGNLIASGGTIGGWTIADTSLTGGTTVLNNNGNIHTTNFNVSTSGIISATGAILKSAVVSGNITCSTLTANSTGTIAGWTIASGKLSTGNVGMQPATYPFYAGSATPASAPFRVDTAGALVATSATITGSVTATTGAIGGWTIGATTLTGGSTTLNSNGTITCANLTANTAGSIGGFNITSNTLSGGTLTINSSGYIQMGPEGILENGYIRLDATSEYEPYRFWIGNSLPTISSFKVTTSGTAYINSLNVGTSILISSIYDTGESYTYPIVEYSGALWTGTGTGGKIFRYIDGGSWAEYFDSGLITVRCATVFSGQLFFADSAGKYINFNGTSWASGTIIGSNQVNALNEFSGVLYAGAINGKVYAWSSISATWSEFYDTGERQVWSLIEYSGAMFVGTDLNGKVFRYDGSWTLFYEGTPDIITTMIEYNGNLFMGGGGAGAKSEVIKYNGASATRVCYEDGLDIRGLTIYVNKLLAFGAAQIFEYSEDMDKFQFAYPESTWNGIVYSVDKALYMTGYQDGTIKKGILNSDLILYDGVLTLNETNTPVASDGYGKIYTKSDNELYFQDGAGTEHSVIVDNGGAIDDIFYENAQDVTADYTVAATRNAMSAGPITIASGVTVTLSSGATWTIV